MALPCRRRMFAWVPDMRKPNGAMESAGGFLELGLFAEAWEELDKLVAHFGAHPEVLRLRWDIARLETMG